MQGRKPLEGLRLGFAANYDVDEETGHYTHTHTKTKLTSWALFGMLAVILLVKKFPVFM
jgi:hypothetical protein